MEFGFRRHSRSSSRPSNTQPAASSSTHRKGKDDLQNQSNASRTLASSTYANNLKFGKRSKENLSKKGDATSAKALSGKAFSKQKESSRSSTSVIAKLMGLDELPPPHVGCKQDKDTKDNLEKLSSARSESYAEMVSSLQPIRPKKQLDFRDVFDVVEISKMWRHKNKPIYNEIYASSYTEADSAYIKQKFVDLNSIQFGERLRHANEFSIAGEVQDSSNVHCHEVFQGFDTLFTRHLHELKHDHCVVCPNTKSLSSRHGIYERGDDYPELEKESSKRSCNEPSTGLFCDSLEGHAGLSFKSPKARNTKMLDMHLDPSQIVVLKPGPSKGHDRTVSFSRHPENAQFGCRKHRDLWSSDIQELCSNARECCKLVDHSDILVPKSESFVESTCLSDDCSSYDQPSSYPEDPLLTKTARKLLSERWQITHNFKEVEASDKACSTLTEILALPDSETQGIQKHSKCDRFTSDENIYKVEDLSSKSDGLGINNTAHCKNTIRVNLEKPRRLPATAPAFTSSMICSRWQERSNCKNYVLKDVLNMELANSPEEKSDQKRNLFLGDLEANNIKVKEVKGNEIPLKEFHLHQKEDSNMTCASGTDELKPLMDMSNKAIADTVKSLHFKSKDTDAPTVIHEPFGERITATSAISDAMVRTKENSFNVDQFSYVSCLKKESNSSMSNEVEHPNPVSVLEPLSGEEKKSSEFLHSIGATLQDLQEQLELLKLESGNRCLMEYEEDADGDYSFLKMEGIIHAFKDEEDRDFSYLLDMLVESGIRCVDQDVLYDASCCQECPVARSVFSHLEKKYEVLDSWPKFERKLLFDFINSALAELLARSVDIHRLWSFNLRRKLRYSLNELVEELWQMVHKPDMTLCADKPENEAAESSWFDLQNDFDVIGREVQSMLIEDILEELVSEVF